MDNALTDKPFWSTAAFGDAIDTSPAELSALGAHLSSCEGARGRWFAVRCMADYLDGFIASRVVTSMSAVALVLVAVLLVI
jgi:hypothetical protein